MTSPCAACSLEFDPQALKGKSFWEGITTGANYGAKVLEAHHALLAEKDRTIAELREALDECNQQLGKSVRRITRLENHIAVIPAKIHAAESALARKKEPSPSGNTPGAGKGSG